MPTEFNVALLEHAHEDGAVYGSKAVGEPPLMLAFSVREALREACAAFGPAGVSVELAVAGHAGGGLLGARPGAFRSLGYERPGGRRSRSSARPARPASWSR